MERALSVLTDQSDEDPSIALAAMLRVIGVADRADYPDDAYAMRYGRFLAQYDPALRRRSGVYYTPTVLANITTRFVDDVLRT